MTVLTGNKNVVKGIIISAVNLVLLAVFVFLIFLLIKVFKWDLEFVLLAGIFLFMIIVFIIITLKLFIAPKITFDKEGIVYKHLRTKYMSYSDMLRIEEGNLYPQLVTVPDPVPSISGSIAPRFNQNKPVVGLRIKGKKRWIKIRQKRFKDNWSEIKDLLKKKTGRKIVNMEKEGYSIKNFFKTQT